MRYSIFLFALMVLIGCSDSPSTVSGTVTLDGQPISVGKQMNGTVNFVREDGGGARAVGHLDESGRYSLSTGAQSGLEPGMYLVGISVNKVTIPTDPNAMPQPKLITPARYARSRESGLTAEVKPGSNIFDFDLASDPKQ